MIYLKPRAGLCNRMRAISSVYYMARKYNTKLVIFWNMDNGLNCRFDKLFVDIPGVKVINYRLKYDFLIKFVGLFIRNRFWNVRIRDRKKYESLIEKGKTVLITTCSNLCEEDNFKCLKIIPEIKSKTDEILSSVDRTHLVGVHIRRTDHVISIEKSTTELFIEEMRKITDSDDSVRFYLATDSQQESKRMQEIFGDRIIRNANVVYGRDSQDGIQNALIDLVCLSECSRIIGSAGSSFSWTAAKWNDERPLCYIGE